MSRTAKASAARRDALSRATQYNTFDGELARAIVNAIAQEKNLRWPNRRYEKDPVGFCRDILGVQLEFKVNAKGKLRIEGREIEDGETVVVDYQAQILRAVAEHNRVAVTSGHKIGKSLIAACLALWFFCTFDEARVVMTSSTAGQVDRILWREICKIQARAGRCVACKVKDPHGDSIPTPCPHSALIPEEPAQRAANGLRSEDRLREIYGFASKEAENVAGISGPRMLFIVDEASGVPDNIFEAIEGNRAGGAKIVMFSNPTRNAGRLYDAFHKNSKFWKKFRISSMRTINYIAGRNVIGGMAEREWVDEMRDEWGEESAWFKVRVLGQHALAEEGRPFDHHTVAEAQIRNDSLPAVGQLQIGLDPAGDGDHADDSAFAVRRGKKWLHLSDKLKTDLEGLAAECLRLVQTYRRKDDHQLPIVSYDAEGNIGYKLGPVLESYQYVDGAKQFDIQAIRASEAAPRLPLVYERQSAELVANLESFVKSGGGLPRNNRLDEELYAWEYYTTLKGRRKVDKRAVKKVIGRSPDRFDALALAAWEPMWREVERAPDLPERRPEERTAANAAIPEIAPDWGSPRRNPQVEAPEDYDDLGNEAGEIRPWG